MSVEVEYVSYDGHLVGRDCSLLRVEMFLGNICLCIFSFKFVQSSISFHFGYVINEGIFYFRVWNTGVPTPWRPERWTVPHGRVAAACFGPNLTLLFTTTEDPATIFSLPLQDNIFDVKKGANNDVKIAMRLIDLTKVNFSSDDNDDYIIVGGRIVSMEWDPTGKYLAILFQVCEKKIIKPIYSF